MTQATAAPWWCGILLAIEDWIEALKPFGARVEPAPASAVTRPASVPALLEALHIRFAGWRVRMPDSTEIVLEGLRGARGLRFRGRSVWLFGTWEGDPLAVDATGAPLAFREMDGCLERLGEDLGAWLWWYARDSTRAQPCPPGPQGISKRVVRALEDVSEESFVRGGASDENDLRRRLEELDIAETAPLREAEARFGGLVTRWLRLGPFQMLRDPAWAHVLTRPCGTGPGTLVGQMHDALLYLAVDGAVWRHSTLGPSAHQRVSPTLEAWVERAACVHERLESAALRIALDGVAAKELARRLGLSAHGAGTFEGDGLLVFEGADPFDPVDPVDGGAVAYASSTSFAASIVRAASGGRCRVASAPWPTMWPGVLRPFEPEPLPPVLDRIRRFTSPVKCTRFEEARAAPLRFEGRPLRPHWPRESGVVRCTDTSIEQLRCVGSRVVSLQRFEANEEREVLYVGAGQPWRDPRWHAEGNSALRWSEGWVSGEMRAWWGHPSRHHDLEVIGEDARGLLLRGPDDSVYRAAYPTDASVWHPGLAPRRVAGSLAAFRETLARR